MPKETAGTDVKIDPKGAYLEVTEARLYYLLRSASFTAHLVSLQAQDAGLTVHSFTFGNNCQLADAP
jgi:hypothetical protein